MVSSALLELIAKHVPTFKENFIFVVDVSNTLPVIFERTPTTKVVKLQE